ncbi:hypothetical protein FPQ18DRAFT_302515 [Pyronema domesticum]|nr:hypothetical protein FPQ18DRAFT_302515 [Pyronema domesticum]
MSKTTENQPTRVQVDMQGMQDALDVCKGNQTFGGVANNGCVNWAIEISQGAPKEQPPAPPAPTPPPPPAQPASCKIEDDGSGGKEFDVQWDKDLNGVDCNKIQAVINDANIKAGTKICVAAGSYPKMQLRSWGLIRRELGR